MAAKTGAPEAPARAPGGGDGETAAAAPAHAGSSDPRATELALPAGIPSPLASKAVFWPPRHGALSKDIFHVPLLFWLVETVRPARVVQLGLRDPGGYLALCQAMDRLGLEGQSWAVADPDEADGLAAARQDQHDDMYGDFSSILTCSQDRASRYLHGAEIDLLVLDMASDDPELAAACEIWLPLMSDRGVIVLSDDGTGSPALLDRLSRGCPMFQSQHGEAALHVILHGASQPERLRHLAALNPGMPGYLSVRQVFSRLGQGLVDRQALQRDRNGTTATRGATEALEASVAEAEAERDKARKEAAEAREFAQQLQAQYNERQADVFDLKRALDDTAQLREERDRAVTEADEAERMRSQAWASFDELRAECDALESEQSTWQARQKKLQAEVKAATRARADLQKKLDKALERRQAIWQAHEMLKAEHRALTARVAEASAPEPAEK